MTKKKGVIFLVRWDDCPLGKELQPGCRSCQKCAHFKGKEWIINAGEGWYETECTAPLRKEIDNDYIYNNRG